MSLWARLRSFCNPVPIFPGIPSTLAAWQRDSASRTIFSPGPVNERCGQTVADLIREKRVERAKALLDGRPDASILRIALESGFPAKFSFRLGIQKGGR